MAVDGDAVEGHFVGCMRARHIACRQCRPVLLVIWPTDGAHIGDSKYSSRLIATLPRPAHSGAALNLDWRGGGLILPLGRPSRCSDGWEVQRRRCVWQASPAITESRQKFCMPKCKYNLRPVYIACLRSVVRSLEARYSLRRLTLLKKADHSDRGRGSAKIQTVCDPIA